jgi:hypothetical protein
MSPGDFDDRSVAVVDAELPSLRPGRCHGEIEYL